MRTEAQKKAQRNYVMKNRDKINEINRKSQKKRYSEDEAYRENRKQRSRDRSKKLKEKKQMEKAMFGSANAPEKLEEQ